MPTPSDIAPKPLHAVAPACPLSGSMAGPGNALAGHAALMLGALAAGTTTLAGLPDSADMQRTAAAMRALGAAVEDLGGGSWRVAGRGIGGLVEPAEVLEMGHSATAARLLCGLLAGHPVFAVVSCAKGTGDAALRRQPMRAVTDLLAATGARFASRAGGRLPLAVEGMAEPLPLDVRLPGTAPAVTAACLLAGLCARGTTRVQEAVATRDTVVTLLRQFGATVRVTAEGQGRLIELEGQPELAATSVLLPGDPTAAAFPIVAALLVPGSEVTLRRVGLNPQSLAFLQALREMGADIREQDAPPGGIQQDGDRVADLVVRASALVGIDLPAGRAAAMIEDYPALAVAAARARGTTRLRGLAATHLRGLAATHLRGLAATHLRGLAATRRHEGDRLAAIAALLGSNGIRHELEGEDLLVHGTGAPPPGGGLVETQMDPRMALSALVLGLATRQPVRIDDGACIERVFPGFAAQINHLLGAGAAPVIGPAMADLA